MFKTRKNFFLPIWVEIDLQFSQLYLYLLNTKTLVSDWLSSHGVNPISCSLPKYGKLTAKTQLLKQLIMVYSTGSPALCLFLRTDFQDFVLEVQNYIGLCMGETFDLRVKTKISLTAVVTYVCLHRRSFGDQWR